MGLSQLTVSYQSQSAAESCKPHRTVAANFTCHATWPKSGVVSARNPTEARIGCKLDPARSVRKNQHRDLVVDAFTEYWSSPSPVPATPPGISGRERTTVRTRAMHVAAHTWREIQQGLAPVAARPLGVGTPLHVAGSESRSRKQGHRKQGYRQADIPAAQSLGDSNPTKLSSWSRELVIFCMDPAKEARLLTERRESGTHRDDRQLVGCQRERFFVCHFPTLVHLQP